MATRKLKHRAHLLAIPQELRDNIYDNLLDSPSTLWSLLFINRQTTKEVVPFLYKQPITFEGQVEFFGWLKKVDGKHLKHVADILFKLQDIDPDKIVGALGKRLRQAKLSGSSSSSEAKYYHEACDLELKRIDESFKSIPNVRHLTVLRATSRDPRPSYHMLTSFSNILGRRFTNLRTFATEESFLPFTCVAPMRRLRQLRFTGMSPISSEDLLKALRKVETLRDMEISRPDEKALERQIGFYASDAKLKECKSADLRKGLPRARISSRAASPEPW